MNLSRPILAAFLSSTVAGCALFKSDWAENDRPTNVVGLSKPKQDSSTVSLDVAFISILADKSIKQTDPVEAGLTSTARSTNEELWRWVDETAISPEVRSALRVNGLRVGRVHTLSEFNRALNAIRRVPQDEAAKLLALAAIGSDVVQPARQVPCRFGKRIELPVRQPAVGEVATLVSLGGNTIGRTLQGPQPLFAVTLQPHDASGIRVRMQPEIQFGAMKQTWVGSDGGMRIENRRDSWSFDDLAFEVAAGEGDTIVAGAVMPARGLGEQMFTGQSADGDVDHAIVLIQVGELPNGLSSRH
jgi:hypothetical protein